MSSLKNKIVEIASKYGFDICRFALPKPLDKEIELYRQWISRGYHASMQYLDKNYDKKRNPKEILQNIGSVIVMGHSYRTPFDYNEADNSGYGLISRYAWGDDYHHVLAEKLRKVIAEIKDVKECDCVSYIDTGPVLERAWAVRSGVGWQGKNGNIINVSIGSYFFLCVILTSLEIEPDKPVAEHCGTCKRCIEACPTGAIIEPQVVDARKCLSYWNIPDGIKSNMSNRLFGCDICQEVCPWNNKAVFSDEMLFYPRNGETSLNLTQILELEQECFSKRFKNSPIKRKKLTGLKQIAEIIIETSDKCNY